MGHDGLSRGLGRSGSAQDAYGWTQQTGAGGQPTRYPGPVAESPTPLPGQIGPELQVGPSGLPTQEGMTQVIQHAILRALCHGEGCIVETQPSHLVHPGWRGIRRTIEQRAILFTTDVQNILAALALGTAEAGAQALFIGPNEGVIASYITPQGRTARIVSVDVNVENGDGARVFGRVEVEGSQLVVPDRRLTGKGLRSPIQDNAYALAPQGKTIKVVVRTDSADDVSPYCVTARLVVDEWPTSRAAVDNIEGASF